MRWLLSYEAALTVAFIIDEMQKNQDYLPHWLKAALPVLGLIGIAIKLGLAKRKIKLAK